MAPDADPYRTLGLTRGAPLAEVKKAYRRLAKANHPDAAGEAALPRFLAIQAAYDQIVGPDASGGPAPRSGGPRRPWDAEPDRADATRRAYGGRAKRARTGGTRRPGGAAPGGAGPGAGPGTSEPPRRDGPPRPPNKATLGSTSYDGAEGEPFEPDWGGASWYGTTSGTYWTLNPKEYADPRKHGPEYQARARRAAAAAREADITPEAGVGEANPDTDGDLDTDTDAPAQPGTPQTTHTTSSWWDATAGPAADPADATPPGRPPGSGYDGPDPSASTWAAAPSDAAAVGGTGAWSWLDSPNPGLGGRVGRAVLGWIPLALAIGWAGGEITGCGRSSADCATSDATLVWVVQVVTLALLLAVPRIASFAAIAAIAAIIAAVPAVVVLSTPGTGASAGGSTAVLVAVLAGAWALGLAAGLIRAARPGPGPVS